MQMVLFLPIDGIPNKINHTVTLSSHQIGSEGLFGRYSFQSLATQSRLCGHRGYGAGRHTEHIFCIEGLGPDRASRLSFCTVE
jgi:hypothetical protein